MLAHILSAVDTNSGLERIRYSTYERSSQVTDSPRTNFEAPMAS